MSPSPSSHDLFLCSLLILSVCFLNVSAETAAMLCSLNQHKTCSAILYHSNKGIPQEQIAFYYSVESSKVSPFPRGNKQDFLITVPCSCNEVNGDPSFLYDVVYTVQRNDTFVNVSATVFSGQALRIGGEEQNFTTGNQVTMHLMCGCAENNTDILVTYTIQQGDVLSDIAHRLSSEMSDIEKLNGIQDPDHIYTGSILFVPKADDGKEPAAKGPSHILLVTLGVLSALTAVSICILGVILIRTRRKKSKKERLDGQKAVFESTSTAKGFSMQSQFQHKGSTEFTGVSVFGSERPLIYSLEEIEEATNNFDESKKIGSGGYACVYHGELGVGQEVAIKKMKSNKSKEFFAELKVLCKIHHRNVVELLGYASGDDHFYLVYEYVQNGSLSDHLHDPVLKGRQPLSWTARVNIALDAAKGIEYIHDHTKARYVHRDIKTSNILLDEKLRAKVADFGLAKLVERGDEEFLATRLVGTPGYLPPESVKELQVTSKTDVFAFGVVLAELITGLHALIRDSKEPNKMKSLISIFNTIFQEEDPESALADVIDGNLGSYRIEDAYKVAELAQLCLSEDPVGRPEMREIVVTLSQIVMSSIEWEASLGGNSPVFSGLYNGR